MNYSNKPKSLLLEEIQKLREKLAAVERTTEKCTTELYKSEERFFSGDARD